MTKIENLINLNEALNYFYDRLNWPISQDSPAIDPYDVNWEYYPEDLGLKDSDFAKIKTLQQMKPLKENQDWAVFFVEFDYKKMQITVLRKILGSLIFNKRGADHKIWNMENLLFVCFWGGKQNRTIGFVHFNQSVKGLPTLKSLYFEPQTESKEKLAQYEGYLFHLKWEYAEKCDAWTTEWKKAFQTEYGQVIRDTTRLTKALAHSAQTIRKQILEVLEIENESGYVHKLLKKFKDNLVHDMDEKSFADMYAQTICYGLFSARCLSVGSHSELDSESFDPIKAIDNIPDTNPFLRQLLKEGLDNQKGNVKKSISFDELELNNIIDLLQNTDIKSIVSEFNRQTRQGYEDPVIHFYEDFLKEYDKDAKTDRGVFYTPLPVVDFIVRSVDHILKTEFGIADGLACDEKVQIEESNGRGKAKTYKAIPKVQILDPATGTGTFLRQTILQIKKNFDEKHKNLSKEELAKEWNKYVILSLLHRMYGFELMMAPYAVAHMKLAMALKDTGYNFESKSRLKVFLTNSLEEPGESTGQIAFFEDAIAVEATQANAIKKEAKINVVMGNPPYSGISSNSNSWINGLVWEYKYTNGVYFNERKHWLNDDYVKFIRLGQYYIEQNGIGVFSYINNHSFLDNPTFRAMRWNLLHVFDKIYVFNLHGNSKRNEVCPDGSKDENVFDIQQGVSINIFIKTGKKDKKSLGQVYYTDLFGTKEYKLKYLLTFKIEDIEFKTLSPNAPFYFFVERSDEGRDEYETGMKLDELMPKNSTGILTARDSLVVDMEKQVLKKRIELFVDKSKTDEEIRVYFFPSKSEKKYLAGDSRGWKLSEARKKVVKYNHDEYIKEIDYRPFDTRFIYYSSDMVDWGREEIMQNLLKDNYALLSCRQSAVDSWEHVGITNKLVDDSRVSNRTKERGYVFPLYIYDSHYKTKNSNFNKVFVSKIENKLGIKWNENNPTEQSYFNPLSLLDYIYAILHTPSYREKYKDFLLSDFPRIPYPKDKEQFLALAKLGGELRELHLMKSPVMDETPVTFSGNAPSEEVTTRKYDNGKVWVNKTEYFDGVPESAWNFYIGGYQVADKWLKDRKGRKLSAEDILHYKRIIKILMETERLMSELDKMWTV